MSLAKTVEPPRRQERQEIQKHLSVLVLARQVIWVYAQSALAQLGVLGVLAVQKPFHR